MSTQTIYFDNPSSITTLQGNVISMSGSINNLNLANNQARGNLISYTKTATVTAYSVTGSLDNLRGPNQNVDIYQIIYYSSHPKSASCDRVSGTLFVPSTITKTSVISLMRGTIAAVDDEQSAWQLFASTGSWISKTPAQRGAITGISAPMQGLMLSGLGYVTFYADGFGVGVSQNQLTYLNYWGAILPQIDLLRVVRKLLISQNPSDRTVFHNFSFSGQDSLTPLPVISVGYSLGAVYTPGCVLEFQNGISDTIPSDEASSFSFQKMMLGGATDFYTFIDYIRTNNSYSVNSDWYGLFALGWMDNVLAPIITRPSAYTQIFATSEYDWNLNRTILAANFLNHMGYNYVTNPPTADYPYNAPTSTGCDLRQLFNTTGTNNIFNYIDTFRTEHGWASTFRPLYPLQNIPCSMIYANSDALAFPLYPDTSLDIDASLDLFMSTGVVNNPYYAYTGASKNITVDTTTYICGVNDSLVISNLQTVPNNAYYRYKVNTSALPASLKTHAGFVTYFYHYIYNALI